MKSKRGFLWAAQLLGVVFIISGCSGINFSQWRFPYMYSVQQGNYINEQQLAELKIGMTKEQVVFVIGNPISQFMFNEQNWQFIYQDHKNDRLNKSYVINLSFDQSNRLLAIEMAGKVFEK